MVSDIIAASFRPNHARGSFVVDQIEPSAWEDDESPHRYFKIRAADSDGHRSSANILVDRMYAWRGYKATTTSARPAPVAGPRITLMAIDADETIGTITVGFDSPQGLLAEEVFPQEIAALRAEGRTVCEFTKLAVDSSVQSKRVLASLFHVAFLYARGLRGCDTLLIEVNPRHVKFYERMLGFAIVAPERLNPRVNAPAVLMRLDFAYAQQQIDLFRLEPASDSERSLYPHGFSSLEEAAILARLRRLAAQAEAQAAAPVRWNPSAAGFNRQPVHQVI